MNFPKDPLTAFVFGVDDDKLEDMSLEEVVDRGLRKRIACNPNISKEDIDAKVARAKKRLANLLAQTSDNNGHGFNLGALLLSLFIGGCGGLITDGFRGCFTDKDGNEMPEDVFKNEFMPLSSKAVRIDTIINNLEELTEDNSCGFTVPDIVHNLFMCKEELLELLRGRKAHLDEELKKIIERHIGKSDKDFDNSK